MHICWTQAESSEAKPAETSASGEEKAPESSVAPAAAAAAAEPEGGAARMQCVSQTIPIGTRNAEKMLRETKTHCM